MSDDKYELHGYVSYSGISVPIYRDLTNKGVRSLEYEMLEALKESQSFLLKRDIRLRCVDDAISKAEPTLAKTT